MADTFQERIPTRPDDELLGYLQRPLDYRTEAVEAAVTELARRGHRPAPEALAALREQLRQRDLDRPRLNPIGPMDPVRLRRWLRAILALGFSAALLIYVTATPAPADALGYDPMDTKRYLRELEVVGGKANVLGAQFQQWFLGLWHGRPLAFMVALATVLLAWLVSLLGAPRPPEPRAGPDANPR
jgi:hypothetical protein